MGGKRVDVSPSRGFILRWTILVFEGIWSEQRNLFVLTALKLVTSWSSWFPQISLLRESCQQSMAVLKSSLVWFSWNFLNMGASQQLINLNILDLLWSRFRCNQQKAFYYQGQLSLLNQPRACCNLPEDLSYTWKIVKPLLPRTKF